MTFGRYLAAAAPATLMALLVLMGLVAGVVRPARDVPVTPLRRRLTLAILGRLYRNVRLKWPILGPALAALALMIAGWLVALASWHLTRELVRWLGAGLALLARPKAAETMLITELPVSPTAQVIVFLVAAALLTGFFSAGPSMAALLEVAEILVCQHPAEPLYIGLALSTCAGSSLFLTAATSGPLTQSLVERARLEDADGNQLEFTFAGFIPVGLLGFTVVLSVNIVKTLWALQAH